MSVTVYSRTINGKKGKWEFHSWYTDGMEGGKKREKEYASLVSDGASGDVTDFIDTGSYIFNALLGGGIHKGLPSNKITAIAGESATGKTFFVLGMCKHFLDQNPDGGVIFFESESAVSKEIIEERQIDSSRMVVMPVTTVQEFRHQALTVLDLSLIHI